MIRSGVLPTAAVSCINDRQNGDPRVENAKGWWSCIGFPGAVLCLTTCLTLATASECKSIFHVPSLLYGIVLWSWWGGIAAAIWALGKRSPAIFHPSSWILTLHVLCGSTLAAVHLILLGSIHFNAPQWRTFNSFFTLSFERLTLNRFGTDFLVYGFVVGIIAAVRFQLLSQREAIHSLELQRQLSTAQLRALQMQIEPHFLFNTLNTISMLIGLGRNEEAMQTLGHLNDILHGTLQRSVPEKVPLSRELEALNHYLAIEQIRFSDRLQIVNSVAPEALDGLVPCFMLQPLIENAVRHGVSRREERGVIHMSAVREGDQLVIHVQDNGPGLSGNADAGHGIGLKNTEERLMHFYPERHRFSIGSPQSGGFTVSLRIPYEREHS